MKNNDNYFCFAFFSTIIFMIITFGRNVEFTLSRPKQIHLEPSHLTSLEKKKKLPPEPAYIKKIKKLIQENKLSDHEALFYEVLEE